jgi:serine/threonine protein phosphatase PrpC
MDKNYFAITDTGKVRDNNEDTFIAEHTNNKDLIIACVIDGVGGYSGGEVASAIASKSILSHLKDVDGDLNNSMKAAILAADQEIMLQKATVKALANMACVLTLAVVDLKTNQFAFAHVGDTRLYLLRDNSLVKISKDQSFVGFMEDSGRLTEEQAMRHPKRNEINKALGFGSGIAAQDDYLDMGSSPFLPGDLLLICSDGLSDMVNKQQMTEILTKESTLEEKAKQLVQAANQNGGLDNITLVLVKNDNEAVVHEVAKPVPKSIKRNTVSIAESAPKISSTPLDPPTKPIEQTKAQNRSGSSGTTIVLTLLCLLFLGSTAYLYYDKYLRTAKMPPLSAVKPPRNAQEKRLQDTIDDLKGNILVLSDSLFKSPILITAPLQINRDTLYLIAEKNLMIKRDSSFRGIPLIIKVSNKHVLLQNFTFEGFDTVISSPNNALVLKDVRFLNNTTAIKRTISFPSGKYINGKLPLAIFKTDSLPSTVTN